jgi:riboflavin kinase / FMN adenylyltransferase
MNRPRSVITIGNFDGVHLGHAALVARARSIAESAGNGARVVAMAFDPHPLTMLRPEEAPARLTTFEQRAALLGREGADEVVRLEPTGNLLGLDPEEFVQGVVRDLEPVAFVEGMDFRFGRGRAGDVRLLAELGRQLGFVVEAVDPPVEVTLSDHTVVRASSRLTRWLLEHGRVIDAAIVLGRTYEIHGRVVRGEQRGRLIGFPTVNIESACMAPGDGVYGGAATLPDGRRLAAAISVGTKPTFGGTTRAVEAFLLDAPTEGESGAKRIAGTPEYGWPIRLSFEHWIRDQVRFDSVGALLEQMARDCDSIRQLGPAREVAGCP